jgi:lipopolysaccharide assembly protein A
LPDKAEEKPIMSFLKTLFWVIFLVGFTIFAVNNWQPVSVKLWGGMWLDTKLPALIGLAFLLGFVPLYMWHRTHKWRMKRRIATLETSAKPLSPPPVPQAAPASEGYAA